MVKSNNLNYKIMTRAEFKKLDKDDIVSLPGIDLPARIALSDSGPRVMSLFWNDRNSGYSYQQKVAVRQQSKGIRLIAYLAYFPLTSRTIKYKEIHKQERDGE